MKKIPLFLAICLLFSCSKEEAPEVEEEVFKVEGGPDREQVGDFSVALNAVLEEGQVGLWKVVSGLVDDKVYFDDEQDPAAVFHGLPGIEYELEWIVRQGRKISWDTIKVGFAPLTTSISDISPDFYTTRLHLQAKNYDRGRWKIEGDAYNRIWNQNWGGTVIPDEESEHIKFFGFENKTYELIWETWYGSVSATDTLHFQAGDYHQFEALEILQVLGAAYSYKLDAEGNVVRLHLGGDVNGQKFENPVRYPSLQALKHLKWLDLSGDGLHEPPSLIATYYSELEYLDLGGNHITALPANFGNLKQLDTLILDHMQGGHVMKELPDSFGELESLKYLDLSGMGIERIPESFSGLTELQYLDLEANFIDKLPEDFGRLTKLKTFRGPSMGADLPESFSKLESLRFCFFFYRHANPKLPEKFGDLDNLETLWAYGDLPYLPESFTDLAQIKDLEFTGATDLLQELPADLGNLRTLERLRIHGSFSSLPESIGDLRNLKTLHISGLLESLPASITQLEQLEYLNLYAMRISEIPADIGNLQNLQYLYLGRNQLTEIPESLGTLEKLYKLDLSYNQIAYFPESLGNLNGNLAYFYIGGNSYSPEELEKIKALLPQVQVVY